MKNIATIDDESEVIPTDKGPFWTWIKVYVSFGFRVHPIQPEEKKPLLEDWPNKATTNLEQIEK
jgi:Bifunctional DNA primase/polymerase, N-terminal